MLLDAGRGPEKEGSILELKGSKVLFNLELKRSAPGNLLKDSNKRIFEIELTELEKIADIKNTNRVYLKKEIKAIK